MKKIILATLFVLTLFVPVKAADYDQQYCTVQSSKFPCEFILIIYGPDGKTVFWAIRIHPDGSQEVIYESEEASPDKGLKEATQQKD